MKWGTSVFAHVIIVVERVLFLGRPAGWWPKVGAFRWSNYSMGCQCWGKLALGCEGANNTIPLKLVMGLFLWPFSPWLLWYIRVGDWCPRKMIYSKQNVHMGYFYHVSVCRKVLLQILCCFHLLIKLLSLQQVNVQFTCFLLCSLIFLI